ncbi:capsid protein [Aureimonas ureilytica]|uniref:Capsid protein n=1 Tax=Aureimonas ureilytica TaxID=401562 RepID=A0A175R9M5_9HYPH|nr:phage major capsid protein [Aureimonas ureilytica]KTQ96581.1 capsid protein [Aureimonas ureilytica]
MTSPLETRSALPLETRDGNDPDPLAAATAAVEELRSASETFRTEQAATAERHATEVRGLTDRIASLETRLNRPGSGGNDQRQEPTVEVRAFTGFVRQGRELLTAEEVRALRTDAQVAGGYLAPDQFEATLLRELVEISPMRQAARVTPVSSGAVILPKRTGRITAKWVGETEDRPGTEPTYGQIEIPVHEMACFVDVSNRLLEDAAVNIEQELAFDFAEEFGRLEAVAFVAGDGIKKPVGIMVDANVATVASGDAAKITPDSLIDLMYALPQAYRGRGSWVMNSRSIAAVRKFKDAGGNFLWADGVGTIADGQASTLLGRPVIEAPDMPDIAAGATPIVYGDFASAYRILDRVGLTVLRDPYTQQTNGVVRFHARRRVGAGVVRPEAVRKLKIGTA